MSSTAITISDLLLQQTVELFDYSPHLIGNIVNKIEFIDETTLYINSLIDQVNQIEALVYESANRILSQFLADGTLTIAVQNVVTPLTQPYIDQLNTINQLLTNQQGLIQSLSNVLNNLSIASSTDATTITNLQSQQSALQNNIQTTLNNLNSLIDLVSTLIENFSSLLIEINSINTQLTLLSGYPLNSMDGQLTTIQTNLATLGTFITNANQELTTNLSTLSGFQTQITTNATNISPLDAAITAIVNQTTEWYDTISSMVLALSIISGNFDETNTAISTENANLAQVTSDFNTAQTNHNNNTTNNQTNITNLNNLLSSVTLSQQFSQTTTTTTLNNGNTVTGFCNIWTVFENVYCVYVTFNITATIGQSQFNLNFPSLRSVVPSNPNWQGQLTTAMWLNHVSNINNNNPATFNLNWGDDNCWVSLNGAMSIGNGYSTMFYIFQNQTPESVSNTTDVSNPYYMDSDADSYYMGDDD